VHSDRVRFTGWILSYFLDFQEAILDDRRFEKDENDIELSDEQESSVGPLVKLD
jgi:hypothetical protein